MTEELQNIFNMFDSPDIDTKLLGLTLFCNSEEVKNRTSTSFYRYIKSYKKCFDKAYEELNGFDAYMIQKCITYFMSQLSKRPEFSKGRAFILRDYSSTLYYKGRRLY